MRFLDVFWRGAIFFLLALLAWTHLASGGLFAGFLLFSCLPVWLFIGLYNQGYF